MGKRYSARRAPRGCSTDEKVGLIVGLLVSVRCTLTLFARNFLAMCPCSVCAPVFVQLLPLPCLISRSRGHPPFTKILLGCVSFQPSCPVACSSQTLFRCLVCRSLKVSCFYFHSLRRFYSRSSGKTTIDVGRSVPP